MTYQDLRDFIGQLEERGELVRVASEVDPYLEIAEICDRTLRTGVPAYRRTGVPADRRSCSSG